MSKGDSYLFTGTKADIIKIIDTLPAKGSSLLDQGWEDISVKAQAANGHYIYENIKTKLKVRFDEGKPGETGFKNKNHYHIMNPDTESKQDTYLDKNGNPCPRGSKQSHIFGKTEEK